MIQDVRPRWDSTYHMMIRALRLKDVITYWIIDTDTGTSCIGLLRIGSIEWNQLRYMVCIAQPFALWTDILSSTSGATIQTAFAAYECLFNHLEDTKTKFQRKKKGWKVSLITAIDSGLNVLRKYYSRTEGPGGVIYNLATVLCPEYKLSLYESKT